MAAAIDDSCRRPGAIPFKWEICPGTPKHVRSSSASAAPPYYTSSAANVNVSKVAVSPKLTPPPAMSPSPYHSPRVSSYYSSSAARSESVSPSRRRPPQHHRPTAFLDVNPRVAPAAYRAGAGSAAEDGDEAAATPAGRCFPLALSFRRRDRSRDGRKGGGRRSSSGTGTASSGSFASNYWSDYGTTAPAVPSGLRRSVSTSSSSCLSLSSRSSGKLAEGREVEAAGGWFY